MTRLAARRIAAVAAVALAASIAGCGADDNDGAIANRRRSPESTSATPGDTSSVEQRGHAAEHGARSFGAASGPTTKSSAAHESSGAHPSSPSDKSGGTAAGENASSSVEPAPDDQPSANNEVDLGAAFDCTTFGTETETSVHDPCEGPVAQFGSVTIGDKRTLPISIVIGPPTAIEDIAISGDDAAEFSYEAGDCQIGVELDVNARCTVEVTFAPAASGERNVRLEIEGDTAGHGGSLNLRGTGQPS